MKNRIVAIIVVLVGVVLLVAGTGRAVATDYPIRTGSLLADRGNTESSSSQANVQPTTTVLSEAGPVSASLVEQIGGAINAVAVEGSRAYVGVGPRLLTVDVSDPSLPAVVGQTEPLSSNIVALAERGDYAYAASQSGGLFIIDVATFNEPAITGFYAGVGTGQAVAVAGDYAYLALGTSGLYIIDVSDPMEPQEVGALYGGYEYPVADVAVVGDLAFLAVGGVVGVDGLRIVDISDPAAPQEVGFANVPIPLDVSVVGSYAYIATGYPGLQILDISDLTTPHVVGEYDAGAAASGLDVAGDYAYVLTDAGINIVDVSVPSVPTEVGYYPAAEGRDVLVTGGMAYLAAVTSLQVIDVAASTVPALVAASDLDLPFAIMQDVVLGGNYAYVAAGEEGLFVLNFTDPETPEVVGVYDGVPVDRLVIEGTRAYAIGGRSLRIVDISSPTAPSEIGMHTWTNDLADVEVAGDYAYVLTLGRDYTESASLRVVDISDPSNPTPLGAFDIGYDFAFRVAVDGDYAFVTAGLAGMRVVDISNPLAPVQVDSAVDAAGHIAISETYAYVSGREGLHIVDIANPLDVQDVIQYPFGVTGMGIDESQIFIGTRAGMQVLDNSDPLSLQLMAAYALPEFVREVAIRDDKDYFVAAAGDAGLLIVKALPEQPPADLTLSGPTEFTVNSTQTFTATVAPITATLPMTFHWEVTGQSPVERVVDSTSDSISLAWADVGTKLISVTATNSAGSVTGTHSVVVSESTPPPTAIAQLALDGPTEGEEGGTFVFTATVTPGSATIPITYQWEASGQAPLVHVSNSLTNTASFSWNVTGSKTVTVTATNAGGAVTASQTVLVLAGEVQVVTPDEPATMSYAGENGTTTVDIPAGAVTETTTFAYNPTEQVPAPPGGLVPAGTYFTLMAYRDGQELDGLVFQQPVTVTVDYEEEAVAGIEENELRLYVWEEEEWVDAATTCVPPSVYQHSPEANRLSVQICHLSLYALLGPAGSTTHHLYLPAILKPTE